MITKQEYERIGETLKGESVYRSKKTGCICTKKDYSYLVLSTLQEIEEAGMAVIEESCGNMDIWFPTSERHNGRKVFAHRKTGHRAVIESDGSIEIVKVEAIKGE